MMRAIRLRGGTLDGGTRMSPCSARFEACFVFGPGIGGRVHAEHVREIYRRTAVDEYTFDRREVMT